MAKLHTKTGSICAVCDENAIAENTVFLHKTRRQTHILCDTCAVGYLAPKLEQLTENIRKNIRNFTITCCGTYHSDPRNKCTQKIPVTEIACTHVSSLHTDLFRIQYVFNNNNVFICPNKVCGELVEVVENSHISRTTCPSCETVWCRICLVSPYHENISCIEYEASQNKTENGKLIWQLKTEGKLKFCPQCKVPTMKKSGCNKMWCITCSVKWCWICTKAGVDYDHFNSGGKNPCANKLWDGENLGADGGDIQEAPGAGW